MEQPFGQPVHFEPPVKLVVPVIARCALLAHTPSMTTVFIKVQFGFVSSCHEAQVGAQAEEPGIIAKPKRVSAVIDDNADGG